MNIQSKVCRYRCLGSKAVILILVWNFIIASGLQSLLDSTYYALVVRDLDGIQITTFTGTIRSCFSMENSSSLLTVVICSALSAHAAEKSVGFGPPLLIIHVFSLRTTNFTMGLKDCNTIIKLGKNNVIIILYSCMCAHLTPMHMYTCTCSHSRCYLCVVPDASARGSWVWFTMMTNLDFPLRLSDLYCPTSSIW